MDSLGVWCIVVCGQAYDTNNHIKMPHAWNIVQLKGNYYHLDVTSMLNYKNIEHITVLPFFNCSDNALLTTHEWDKQLVPRCVDNEYSSTKTNGNCPKSNQSNSLKENLGNYPVINSEKALIGLLKKGLDGKIKFKYYSIKSIKNQQTLIMNVVKAYCADNNIFGSFKVSYENGVWVIEITVS